MAKTSAGCIIFLSLSHTTHTHTRTIHPFSFSVLSRIIMNVFCDHLRELSMITNSSLQIFVRQKMCSYRNSICSAIMHTPTISSSLILSLSVFFYHTHTHTLSLSLLKSIFLFQNKIQNSGGDSFYVWKYEFVASASEEFQCIINLERDFETTTTTT